MDPVAPLVHPCRGEIKIEQRLLPLDVSMEGDLGVITIDIRSGTMGMPHLVDQGILDSLGHILTVLDPGGLMGTDRDREGHIDTHMLIPADRISRIIEGILVIDRDLRAGSIPFQFEKEPGSTPAS